MDHGIPKPFFHCSPVLLLLIPLTGVLFLGVFLGLPLSLPLDSYPRTLGNEEESTAVAQTLRFRLLHPKLAESPSFRNYPSLEEELVELVASDISRVHGFGLSHKSQSPSYPSSLSPSPSPSPSPLPSPLLSPDGFKSPVVSGATLGRVGQYFVELYVGSPRQRFLFVADTGSDLIWVPCHPCPTCSTNITLFHPHKSSTFSPISCTSEECFLVPPPPNDTCSGGGNCNYDYIYQDSSETRGVFAYDTVSLVSSAGTTEVKIDKIALGCGTENSGSSFINVGGVVGLGQGPISFTSQMSYRYGSKFSYCLSDYFESEPASSFLVFGERSSESFMKEAIQYTPFLENRYSDTYYYIGIESIYIDGRVLPIPPSTWSIDSSDGNGGSIIDTGTTLTYFREPAYSIIRNAFDNVIRYPHVPSIASLDLCYNVSGGAKAPNLPKFSIAFRNKARFSPKISNYFLEPAKGVRCLGFLPNPLPIGMTIIGNLLQQHFYVEYDKAGNQLGFAKSNCKAQLGL